jgi:hypothetical protein
VTSYFKVFIETNLMVQSEFNFVFSLGVIAFFLLVSSSGPMHTLSPSHIMLQQQEASAGTVPPYPGISSGREQVAYPFSVPGAANLILKEAVADGLQ